VFANVEGDSLHQWKHFNQQVFPAIVAIQSRSRSLRLAATGRCAFHSQLAGLNRAPGFLNGSSCVDFLFRPHRAQLACQMSPASNGTVGTQAPFHFVSDIEQTVTVRV
jgi:hypothetical protein